MTKPALSGAGFFIEIKLDYTLTLMFSGTSLGSTFTPGVQMKLETRLTGEAELPRGTQNYTQQGEMDCGHPTVYIFSCNDFRFKISDGKLSIEGRLVLGKYRSRFKTVPNGPSWLPEVLHFLIFWRNVWTVSTGWPRFNFQIYSHEALIEKIRTEGLKQNMVLNERHLLELMEGALKEAKALREIWEPFLLEHPQILRSRSA